MESRRERHLDRVRRNALVLGATSGIGGETASALLRHGWRVRALTRDPAKAAASASAPSEVDWRAGNARDRRDVVEAARGAALIVHAVNPPWCRHWDRLVLPMIENTIAAARESSARVLLPATIYNYGPDAFPVLSEQSPQHPTTHKGNILVQLERRLQAAEREGVKALVLRAGDSFGPRPGNSWFSQVLVKPGRPVRFVTDPCAPGVGHAWAFLPDLAETLAQLAGCGSALAPFDTFHFEGHWDADGTAMISAIAEAIGNPNINVKRLQWDLLRFIAPFNETARELLQTKSLWFAPVRLDNRKLIRVLGAEPRVPLVEAVKRTLRGIGVL